MNAVLRNQILENAEFLGLSLDSAAVKTALETADLALQNGYGQEIASGMAREVLNKAAIPAA